MKGNTKKRGGLLLTICAVVVTSALVLAGCDNGGGGGEEQSQQSSTGTTVTAFDLTALVTKPVRGASPVTTISTSGTAQYTGSVAWKKNDDTSHTGVFEPSTVYKAMVTLTAQTGYTFTGVGANKFTHSDAAEVTNEANSGTVTITFPRTALPLVSTSELTTLLNLTEITGDTAASPHTVTLTPPEGKLIEIDNSDTSADGIWATINSLVQNAQKYVILDLSACAVVNNTISGYGWNIAFSANKMNIIQNNQYIKGIILPNTLTTIGNIAFANCAYLTGVTIPNSVTTIERNAFTGCTTLTGVTIPGSVTTIENYAFNNCAALTGITIPQSVTTMGEFVFFGCTGLTGINVDTSNANYSSQDGVLFNKNKTTLIQYPLGKSETSYSIPQGVTIIGSDSFRDCTILTGVTIPEGVTTIGGSAFYSCTNLADVTIPDGVTYIGVSAFYACNLTSVTIPGSVSTIWNYAFSGCNNLNSVTIQQGVTTIGGFSGCTSLTNISIPDSVTTIAESAFGGCTALTGITIPDSVTSIGNWAFQGCTNLAGITIPDGVTSIGDQVFRYCPLASITLSGNVTAIGVRAFDGCADLISVTFGNGSNISAENFGADAFPGPYSYGGDSLKTAYLAAGPHGGTYTREENGDTWTKQP